MHYLKLLSLFSVLICFNLKSQDTLRVMSYNILNYSSGGSYSGRYADLREILSYVKPDIVVCSEVLNASGAQLLLDNAFNMAGIGTFSRATFIDGPDTDNSLFYNNSKFVFKQQNQITTALRNITRYRVYNLISPTDTAWINLFSLHLKASSGFEAARLEECKAMCTFFAGLNSAQNIIVGGDFNFYSSITETGFQWITSTSCAERLYDPINRIGGWNNNSSFSDVHTQSTRVLTEPDGGSTGGMDDRFDFIFANDNVINGTNYVRYIGTTYTTVGQDMNHFNKAITDPPTNSSVPASVATALYNMSDHLPIYIDVAIGTTVGISEYKPNTFGTNVKWINDGNYQNESRFIINSKTNISSSIVVYDLMGKEVFTTGIDLKDGENFFTIPDLNLQNGNYLMTVGNTQSWTGCKFIVY
jgi:hypothetical protein